MGFFSKLIKINRDPEGYRRPQGYKGAPHVEPPWTVYMDKDTKRWTFKHTLNGDEMLAYPHPGRDWSGGADSVKVGGLTETSPGVWERV